MTADDFGPDLPMAERQDLEGFVAGWASTHAPPRPEFRRQLRAQVVAIATRRRARARVTVYLVTGASLLGVVALGLADVGPLAPQPPTPAQADSSLSWSR